MWINTALFVVGISLCQQLSVLPNLYFVLLISTLTIGLLLLARNSRLIIPLICFFIGFFWALFMANINLNDRLTKDLIKKDLTIKGEITDLPHQQGKNWHFNFKPELALSNNLEVQLPHKIRLSWYYADKKLKAGQSWQFRVKLKPPVGLLNESLFDYEMWLFQQGIGAKGYVKNDINNRLLEDGSIFNLFPFLREKIRENIHRNEDKPESRAVLAALVVGDKSAISQDLWTVFRRTGVNHLIAISGLHIGLIAVLSYWLIGYLWRMSARLCLIYPAPYIQSISALLFSFLYSGLAGFSISTQRALIMLVVVLSAKLVFVNLRPTKQLSIAVFAVLILNPISVVSPGFWLSFVAVASIFFVVYGKQQHSKIFSFLSIQWSITLFMMPFLLFWFNEISIISPIVNLVLVPLFSFAIVPLGLLVSVLDLIDWWFFGKLLDYYLILLDFILVGLNQVSQLSWSSFEVIRPNWGSFIILLLSAFIWHFPVNITPKIISLIAISTVFYSLNKEVRSSGLVMTVLDVGQGLSLLIEQGRFRLVYDLGPRYGKSSSATESVVLPFLKNKGIDKIDQLVISHLDSDHSGNYSSFLNKIKVDKTYSGEKILDHKGFSQCQTENGWSWGQTSFVFLNNSDDQVSGNNASCVLKITVGNYSILLTGDIEKAAENTLLKNKADMLDADIVVIPHHGSKTSSSKAFIEAINPQIVVNSSGYLNRYNFPANSVKQRWESNGAMFLDTAMLGSIKIKIAVDNQRITNEEMIKTETFFTNNQKYWYWQREG